MIQSYPWYIADWRESETRIRLSLPERALYRELLDYCYLEGSLPTDPVQLSRIAGCTINEIKRFLPAVTPLFYRKDERMFHAKVDEVRIKLEKYHEQKKHAGSASGRTRRERALERDSNGRSTGDGTKPEPSPSPSPAPSPAPAPAPAKPTTTSGITASEYPLLANAVTAEFPGTDDALLCRIVQSSAQAYAGVDIPRILLGDSMLADAVRAARAQTPGQYNAVLYETTVPKVIRTWAKHGKSERQVVELRRNLSVTERAKQRAIQEIEDAKNQRAADGS